MKFNHKNRPRRSDFPSDEHGLFQFALKLDDWCEDNEKELNSMLWKQVTDLEVQGWNKAIKEILGE